MRFAQAKVWTDYEYGETVIDLSYSYYADNTWYSPSPGLIGATSGTWDISWLSAPQIVLDSDGARIGSGAPFGGPSWPGYPFSDANSNITCQIQFWRPDASWYTGKYLAMGMNQWLKCWWSLNYY